MTHDVLLVLSSLFGGVALGSLLTQRMTYNRGWNNGFASYRKIIARVYDKKNEDPDVAIRRYYELERDAAQAEERRRKKYEEWPPVKDLFTDPEKAAEASGGASPSGVNDKDQ